MSNTHGFDFLRREHLDHDVDATSSSFRKHDDDDDDDDDGGGDGSPSHIGSGSGGMMTEELFKAAQNKPALEKQFDILHFLQAHRGSGCLAPNVIYKSTGIDLEVDTIVAEMLHKNPKVRVEMVPDPENPALFVATYAYQAKYATVRDRTTLLAQVNRMPNGVPMRDLQDSYPTVEEDLDALVTAGDVLAVLNSEDKDKILFPRGEAFLVELDGIVTLPTKFAASQQKDASAKKTNGDKKKQDSITSNGDNPSMPPPASSTSNNNHATSSSSVPEVYVVETDMNPKKQIRRGEAVSVGGQWFRVSSAVKAGVKLSEQPSRAQAPLSVVSLTDLSKRNEVDGYIRPFSAKTLPLDASLTATAQRNLHHAKMARERLLKLAHGGRIGSGVAGQLLGSQAHASNPNTLAASFAGSIVSSMRKRPHAKIAPTTTTSSSPNNNNNTTNSSDQQQQQQQQRLQQQEQQRNQRARKEELEKAAADPNLSLYSHARRHGCTRDIREMYLATRTLVPESDFDLHALLVQHKLLEPQEQMRRPRLAKSGQNVDNDGKPKKRRYYERKNQRMTNTHLEGTAIGAALARAAEQQKQGKSVGDGGM